MKSLINAIRNSWLVRKKFGKVVTSSPHAKLIPRCCNNVKVKANEIIKVPEENTDEYLNIPGAEKSKATSKAETIKATVDAFNHTNGKLKFISNLEVLEQISHIHKVKMNACDMIYVNILYVKCS